MGCIHALRELNKCLQGGGEEGLGDGRRGAGRRRRGGSGKPGQGEGTQRRMKMAAEGDNAGNTHERRRDWVARPWRGQERTVASTHFFS